MKRDTIIGASVSVLLHFGLLASLAYGLEKTEAPAETVEKIAEVFLADPTPPPPPEENKQEETSRQDSGEQAADNSPPAAALGEPPPTMEVVTGIAQQFKPSLAVASRPDSLGGIPSHRSGSGGAAAAKALSDVFTLKDLDRKPTETFKAPPIYPPELRRQGVSGTADILIVLDVDGNVVDATVRLASHPKFGEAAVAAVRQWKFKPGFKGGKAVSCRLVLPVTFRLEKN